MLGFGALGQQPLGSRPLAAPGRFQLAANLGSFTLTGQAAGLRPNRAVIAAHATFSLSGQDVALRYGKIIVVAHGSFVLTGQAADLRQTARVMPAAHGAFTLGGQSVTLGYFRPRRAMAYILG